MTGATVPLPALPVEAPPPKQPWWKPKSKSSRAAAALAVAEGPPPDLPPAPIVVAPQPGAMPGATPEEEPCPYCGASTLISHRSCRACKNSLMAAGTRREQRSIALKILVGLYGLGLLGALLGSLMQIGGLFELVNTGVLPGTYAAGIGGGTLLFLLFYAWLTFALWQRKAVAYILHWIGVIIGLLNTVGVIILVFVGASAFAELGDLAGTDAEMMTQVLGAFTGIMMGVVFCNVIIMAIYLGLSVACRGDFFAPKVRMSTAGNSAGAEPFNTGIQYRNRGMWYMASRAWEAAVASSPDDATARHALGLAYAQLKRYDKAHELLLKAQDLEPDNPRIRQDLGVIERRLAKQPAQPVADNQ